MLNFLNLKSKASHLFFWVAFSLSILCPGNKVCSELPDTKGKTQFLVNVMDLVSIRGRKKTAPDSDSQLDTVLETHFVLIDDHF